VVLTRGCYPRLPSGSWFDSSDLRLLSWVMAQHRRSVSAPTDTAHSSALCVNRAGVCIRKEACARGLGARLVIRICLRSGGVRGT